VGKLKLKNKAPEGAKDTLLAFGRNKRFVSGHRFSGAESVHQMAPLGVEITPRKSAAKKLT
jgi:hypothetical protein